MAPSPFSLLRSPFSPGSKFSALLRTYFRSGWAFFIPYLAAYLLYAWLDGPVNPANGGVEAATGAGREAAPVAVSGFSFLRPPALLHVYWFLHVFHAVLGGLALITGRRRRLETGDRRPVTGPSGSDRTCHAPSTRHSSLDSGRNSAPACREPVELVEGPSSALQAFSFSALQKSAPWLLLALIFWIPGIYLEWPSDPWEHLRRVNEWQAHSIVTDHSSWKKSSYFLPYSLTQHVTGLTQLSWLDLYYTAVCLLLSWQYYLLARAVGLGERASFVFVLLNALTFGNNIFSFYRYYGISSSILAQLGAVALTRLALEATRKSTELGKGERDTRPILPAPFALLPSALCLAALTAFNHIQGLGIAGLGILAVIAWRLIEWKRSMLFWMLGASLVLSIAVVLWFPRNPALDDVYRPQGWLNGWYGFDVLSPSSPTFERALHILGFLGIANVVLGFSLAVRRNDIAGWLPLTPFIILTLPCFALPVTSLLASQSSVENIVTFHRLLLAAPLPLALVVIGAGLARVGGPRNRDAKAILPHSRTPLLASPRGVNSSLVFVSLLGLVSLPPDDRSFNRFWHAIQITPKDLQLRPYMTTVTESDPVRQLPDGVLLVDTPLGAETEEAFSPNLPSHQFRQIHTVAPETGIASRMGRLADTLSSPASRYIDSTGESERSLANILIRVSDQPVVRENRLVADLTATNSLWLSLGGHAPRSYRREGKLVLGNAPGTASHVFNAEMIPVQAGKRYLLSATIRQTSGTGTNYLAVAWYDQAGRLLVASEPAPMGAGSPFGWAAGTYSYYGLVNQTANPEWTRYSISFGMGEMAGIPLNAAFMRAGALLNETYTPNSSAELTELILREVPGYRQIRLVAPEFKSMVTSGSQAAWLSVHWTPQHVATQQMGTKELRAFFGGGRP